MFLRVSSRSSCSLLPYFSVHFLRIFVLIFHQKGSTWRLKYKSIRWSICARITVGLFQIWPSLRLHPESGWKGCAQSLLELTIRHWYYQTSKRLCVYPLMCIQADGIDNLHLWSPDQESTEAKAKRSNFYYWKPNQKISFRIQYEISRASMLGISSFILLICQNQTSVPSA